MDLAVIDTPGRYAARRKFLEYKRSVADRHNAEDEAIMLGYRQMSLGRRVISLRETIRRGGTVKKTDQWYDHGYGMRNYDAELPALAIMRAHRPQCLLDVRGPKMTFHPGGRYRGTRDTVTTTWLFKAEQRQGPRSTFKAMVPIVPPALRPKAALHNFHVLWEAKWTRETPLAPEDPALLKRITADLFVVLATWDLTELERAVLGARS